MTTTVESLAVRLIGDTADFGKKITEADRQWSGFTGKLDGAGKAMTGVGQKMTLGITAPVLAAGGAVLALGGDFEASMNRVGALTGLVGDTSGAFEGLKDLAKELGATTQFSASEAADAMGFLAMAGFDAVEIMGAMPSTLQLAAAAGVDLGTAADITSNILSGMGLSTEELAHANDVLVKAMTSSNVDLGMLGESMKYAAPVASGLGYNLEETAAAIGMMGNAGIQGSMAGTALRSALADLAAPTEAQAALMQKLGVEVDESGRAVGGLTGLVSTLASNGASASDIMSLFGKNAGPGMLALVNQGSAALAGLEAKLRDSGGAAQTVADANMKGLNGATKELVSALEGLAIAVAESGLIEFAADLTKRAAGLIQNLAKMNPQMLRWGVLIAGAAAAIGPLLIVLGGMASGISAVIGVVTTVGPLLGGLGGTLALLTGPIGLVIAAVTLLAVGWNTDFLGMRTKAKEFWGWLTGNWPNWMGNIRQGWEGFSGWWSRNSTALFGELRSGWQGFTGWLSENTSSTVAREKTAWGHHKTHLETLAQNQWDSIRNIVGIQMDAIRGVTTAGIQFMQGNWSGGLETLRGTVDSIWNRIQSIFQAQLGNIRQGWEGFSGWWSRNSTALFGELRSGWQGFTGWLSENTSSTVAREKTAWGHHKTHLETLAQNQWDSIRNIVGIQMDAIRGVTTAGIQFMQGNWSGGLETLRGTVDSIWNRIQSIFQAQLGNIRNLFSWFGWGEIGESITRGIANGISRGAQWIIDAAQSAAQSALNAAKSLLGIHSPSAAAREEIGKPYSEGIAEGASRAMPDAVARIQSALNGLLDGVVAPKPALAGAESGAVNITVRIEHARDYDEANRGAHDGVRAALREVGLA